MGGVDQPGKVGLGLVNVDRVRMEGSRRKGCLVQLLVHGWFGEQPQRKAP